MVEAIPLTDGVTATRSDKKECKEEFSIKIFQPSNKNFNPLFLAADSEAEIVEWIKDINKGESLGIQVKLIILNVLMKIIAAQAVFGVDLSVAVKKNKQSIPVVVEKCIQYLRNCMYIYHIHTYAFHSHASFNIHFSILTFTLDITVPGIFRVSGAQSEVLAYKVIPFLPSFFIYSSSNAFIS